MKRTLILFFILTTSVLFSAPPRKVPSKLYHEFTEEGRIPVSYYLYRDDSYSPSKPIVYTTEAIKDNINRITQRNTHYYGATDHYLYDAIEKYLPYIKDKKVGIIGSVTPWYESVVLRYGGKPITVEYNKIISKDPRVKTMTVKEYESNPIKFDAILSISSYEHDGLGRYGDPINPYGDLEAMQKVKSMLKKEGLLFLAVPVGKDRLCWNVHRIYGEIRLPMLLKNWETVDSFGFKESDFQNPSVHATHQPVFVLRSET